MPRYKTMIMIRILRQTVRLLVLENLGVGDVSQKGSFLILKERLNVKLPGTACTAGLWVGTLLIIW
jgi:hypothetical protein